MSPVSRWGRPVPGPEGEPVEVRGTASSETPGGRTRARGTNQTRPGRTEPVIPAVGRATVPTAVPDRTLYIHPDAYATLPESERAGLPAPGQLAVVLEPDSILDQDGRHVYPVTGLITLDKHPDMRSPHIQGVTFWLYRMWGRDATTGKLYLLYVGETSQNPIDRLQEHLTSRTAPARFFKHLIFAWEVDPRVFPSKQAALAAEAAAIRNEYPARNRKGQPADNHRWTGRDRRDAVRLRQRVATSTWVLAAITATVPLVLAYLADRAGHAPQTWLGWLAALLCPAAATALLLFGVRRTWRAGRSTPDRKSTRGGKRP